MWVFLLFYLQVSSSALDHEACRASGYSNQLSCSTCIELKKYRLAVLQESCFSCCKDDSSDFILQKFPYAEVTVCSFVLHPVADRFPNLDVNYKPGSKPTISLLDSSKVVKETFSMEGWDFDTIVEFLRDRLA
ncbi:unnamed protein product [Protopolystoma xenopodis]|uniref:Selenoprotein F n=1 Tax=Protopolystoma xenopodis TaxID=117903 RepID=A0A3S5FBK3_9PLAT|nr:unnamed protein product [Protopolystoma xenopodis]